MEQLVSSTETVIKTRTSRQHPQFDLPKIEFYNAIDRNNFWFPEELTVWWYLKAYSGLSTSAKLRYNQLYSVSVNEIFGIFESDFLAPILTRLSTLASTKEETDTLNTFCEEEIKHAKMFRDLNSVAMPEFYGESVRYLTRKADPIGLLLTSLIVRFPFFFGVWLWITLFFEERTIIYSKAFYKLRNNEVCGIFREAHRLHMIEEVHHVHLDETLADAYYRPLGKFRRWLAGKMFNKVIQNFSSPKRLSFVIAEILRDEFPEEQTTIDACIAELPSLRMNAAFQNTYFGSQSAPRTWKLMARYPELSPLIPKSAQY
jgi:hypothetical protein